MTNIVKHYKVIVIGSGPAGYTAAIYLARSALNPLLISGFQVGGQLSITTDVENFPGFADPINGPWLMEQMHQQSVNVGTEILQDQVVFVDFNQRPFLIKTESGQEFTCDSAVIATGAQAKWLGIPSEQKFQGYGVSGCATCDGFFYKNKKVIVIGGGNSAVEEALHLTHHASEVLLVHRRDSLRAEKILQERLFKHPKVKVLWNHSIQEILGDENPKSVTGAILLNNIDNSLTEVKVDGIFVAIGHKPNTAIFSGQIDLDQENYIITKPNSTKTNISGVFASGDVQDKIYRQAVTAAGTGCMAALEAAKFLDEK